MYLLFEIFKLAHLFAGANGISEVLKVKLIIHVP